MAVNYPSTLTDASSNSGALIMTLFNYLKTLIDTTKLDRDQIQFPRSDCPLILTPGSLLGSVAGLTYRYYVKIPASLGVEYKFVSLLVAYDTEAAADVTIRADVRSGIGGAIIVTATASAPDSAAGETAYTGTVAAGTVLQVDVVVTTPSGAETPTGITVTIWGSTAHRT